MANLTRSVLNGINGITEQRVKAGIISLATFKAFDCAEWPILKVLIKVSGFGKHFKGIIDQVLCIQRILQQYE